MGMTLSAGRRRRFYWRADGDLHKCADCHEPVFFHRRSKRWLDDDGRLHTHPPLPGDWHWFRTTQRSPNVIAWWNRC